jgi:hypothetical protein
VTENTAPKVPRLRDARGRFLPAVPAEEPRYLPAPDLFMRGGTVCSLCGGLVVNEEVHTRHHLRGTR